MGHKEERETYDSSYVSATTIQERNVWVKSITSGLLVDGMDYLGYWWRSSIVKLDKRKKHVLVHFQGFPSVYDEWIPWTGERLAPLNTFSLGGRESGGVLDQEFRSEL